MNQLSIAFPVPDASRLARQQAAVLARLREGEATTADLNAICTRFGARICELRKQGHDIRTGKQGGIAVYRLKEQAQ